MDRFLDEDKEFYFVELLIFAGEENWATVGLPEWEEKFFVPFLRVLKDRGGTVEFVLGYQANFGSLEMTWNGALVTRWPNGDSFRAMLNDRRLAEDPAPGEEEDDEDTITPFKIRKRTVVGGRSWATVLNNEPKNRFGRRLLANQTTDPRAELSMLHAMMLKRSTGTGVGGKFFVSRFDEGTAELKSEESIRSQGWFVVEATCTGDGPPFQEIRIETAPTLDSYSEIIQESRWVEEQQNRQFGIEDASFSTLSFPRLYTDQYATTDECNAVTDTCNSTAELVLVTPDPEKDCDLGSCPCNNELRSCSGRFFVPRNPTEDIEDFDYCEFEDCDKVENGPINTDVEKCRIPDGDNTFFGNDEFFYLYRDEQTDEFPDCRQDFSCNDDSRFCGDTGNRNDGLGYVGRELFNNCEFESCSLPCNNELKPCNAFGLDRVERNPYGNCAFYSCGQECDGFVECEGGRRVPRKWNPLKEQCEASCCTNELLRCPPGSFIEYTSRNPADSCNFFPCRTKCPADRKECDNGAFVTRDPHSNCEFFPCPCNDEVKSCPFGPPMPRDPENDCEFFPCKMGPTQCTFDAKLCPNGKYVFRDPYNFCNFPPCSRTCPDEERKCPNGDRVLRDPDNDCKFFPCPVDNCPNDQFTCGNDNTLERDPEKNCRFDLCPEERCSSSVNTCLDTSKGEKYVALNPNDSCSREKCSRVCALDVKVCSDGRTLVRNPNDDCNFPSCDNDFFCGDIKCPIMTFLDIEPSFECNDVNCDEIRICKPDVEVCDSIDFDSTVVLRNPYDDCEFYSCN